MFVQQLLAKIQESLIKETELETTFTMTVKLYSLVRTTTSWKVFARSRVQMGHGAIGYQLVKVRFARCKYIRVCPHYRGYRASRYQFLS